MNNTYTLELQSSWFKEILRILRYTDKAPILDAMWLSDLTAALTLVKDLKTMK